MNFLEETGVKYISIQLDRDKKALQKYLLVGCKNLLLSLMGCDNIDNLNRKSILEKKTLVSYRFVPFRS